ncbi:MAG: response regulator [Proteobacteria bacterium]|nr:response regulator [Pseudomonadota bacterium]
MSNLEKLRGRRVLIVEDELMIAMLVEDMLADLGCAVVGPAHTLEAALKAAETEPDIDAALLDVNLAGQPVFPVADALRSRGAPLIFSTGYGEAGLRDVDAGAPVLQKPFRAGDLARALQNALGIAA